MEAKAALRYSRSSQQTTSLSPVRVAECANRTTNH